ncbi:MAG: dipeptidase [Crocinitomicaceae bacterium]|nr:dipeptidase [Crocinitomicaceae bacterium]
MKDYIEIHADRFIEELKAFLRIPSISADPKYIADIKKASEFLVSAMDEIGINTTTFLSVGHPIVYGTKHIDDSYPTVLIYGHYDVQPADPIDLWDTPPFEPAIRDGKIYARGACDDKAQVYLILKALEAMINQGALHCNVKLIFEGEEEIGSRTLEQFICNNKSLLAADAFLVCDTSMPGINQPALINSLRGICYCEITINGAPEDLHSGMLGGAIINPLTVLCSIIGKLKNDDHRILIPGFYDGIQENKLNDFNLNPNPKLAPYQTGEVGYTPLEQMTIRPTLDIHGVTGGYSADGPKTVIPSQASAKFSMRLVEGQDEAKIFSLLENYIKTLAPKETSFQLNKLAGSNAVQTDTNSKACKSAELALKSVFNTQPTSMKIGGTIPVVSMIKEHLNLNPILMGFGLETDNIHGPNEHFHLNNFFKGIEAVSLFLNTYGEKKMENTKTIHEFN